MKTRHISRRFRRFARANEAVSALEYAILVGVITVGVGVALLTFSTAIQEAIKGVGDGVKSTTSKLDGKEIDPDSE
ncbi:MAG: hypothetical protein OXC28_07745 [Defluviicoccus sp.]|nr:hypothetical protein [Defluviicoccus sp.]